MLLRYVSKAWFFVLGGVHTRFLPKRVYEGVFFVLKKVFDSKGSSEILGLGLGLGLTLDGEHEDHTRW